MPENSGLRYTGGGYGGWLPGVPARDLSAAEVDEHGSELLLASGLYARFEKPRPETNKALAGPEQNKDGE